MKSTGSILLSAGALIALSASLHAQIGISLTADGSGRFIDYFSNAYAQIDLDPDGMYSLSDNSPFGAVDGFPNEGDWADVGELTLSGAITGVGTELFSITGASFDFDPYARGDRLSIAGTAYTTDLSGVTGSVTLVDGVVDDLSFSGNIAFTFASYPTNPFDGTLTLTESAFTLFVDETETDFSVRQAWDFTGGVTTSPTIVPEPSAYALLAGIIGLGCACCRRRAKR